MGPGSFFNYSRYFAEGYYPINYYEAHSVRGFDIAPNVPDTPFRFADATTTVFSNTIGCFDRNTPTALAAGRYALLVGDSFAWGFAPFEDKWGTLVEQATGIPIAKCGVSHTGQLPPTRQSARCCRGGGATAGPSDRRLLRQRSGR